MEEYLKQLFQKDGTRIFHTDYHLFLKLMNKYPEETCREYISCINAILGGNAFYEKVVSCLEQSNSKMSPIVYNTFIDQISSRKRFWKDESYDSKYLEQILRMMFEVASIDMSDIPKRIIISNSVKMKLADLEIELESAEDAYAKGEYKVAFQKAVKLFNQGVNEATSLLGRAYYTGNGTRRDYNKAMFYITYPHSRSKKKDEEERKILEKLLEMRDNTAYSALTCIVGSVLIVLLMVITKFFLIHTLLAIVGTLLLIGGCALFVFTYLKRYIFDFREWFFLLGGMFLTILIL